MEVEGRSTSPVIMTVFVLFFGAVSAFIYYRFWKIYTEIDLLAAIGRAGFPLLFAFFFTAIVFKYFILLLKPPKWLKAKLVRRTYKENHGRGETLMVFTSDAMQIPAECSTIKENNFEEGKEYKILVKEFTNRIYKVDYLTGEDSHEKKRGESHILMVYVIVIVGILTALIPFIGVIVSTLSKNRNSLLPLMPVILFCVVFLISALMGLPILITIIKEELNPVSKIVCGRGRSRGVESLPPGMGNGEKAYIKRVKGIAKKYHVLNEMGNKILEAKLDSSRFRTFLVKNNYDECIATIHYSGQIKIMGKYEVQIGYEEPFSIKNSTTTDPYYRETRMGYEVIGLDYEIKTDITRNQFKITDLDEKTLAYINPKKTKDGRVDANDSELVMASGVENNIYILLMALTIFMSEKNLSKSVK